MLISPLPYWIGMLVVAIVLAATAMPIIKAKSASAMVADVDEKISQNTFFIKNLTVDAEGLMSRAKTPEDKTVCKKVYEALRYSDPMSSDALTEIEKKIQVQFDAFSENISDDAAEELLLLIGERNSKCKMMKE